MGHAISSADLDSDHKLRNDKLSKLIETPTAKTDGEEVAKDPNSVQETGGDKPSNSNAKDSTKASAKTEGGK
ncbi:hypothetical protein LPTSP2_37940 [Leptospira ellinghausenii]|uniref:Uncharacterized protein n=1 Tax=Leptospira ellinghausenii TaxID=1917822 RepID=A0A2P2DIT0_9LEPT|nr:hypothetical protein [Leptospira ellinghausenii]GBF44491.1 hypothetical protein LPTSP2_37940 [Leptospira ellinghausenii]